jgi:hypothetical protein
MPKKSDPLPEWFQLRTYKMDLSPVEWAIQIEKRIDFKERYITKESPLWEDEKQRKTLENDLIDLPTTWKELFISPSDNYDMDLYFSRIYENHKAQYNKNEAVVIMRGKDTLSLAAALSENQELLISTFIRLASLYETSVLFELDSEKEKQKMLNDLHKESPLLHSVVLETMDKGYSPREVMELSKSYIKKTYLECLIEHPDKPAVSTLTNFDKRRLWVGINTEIDNETILEELGQKLNEFRDKNKKHEETTQSGFDDLGSKLPSLRGKNKPREKITQKELDKWKRYGILIIFDLTIWADINNLYFTDSTIANAACASFEIDAVSHLRKTARPKMQEVFTRKIINILKNTTV